jgi:aryl-alcohol dehydrogenase-like predicted oxidoreductase
MFHRRAIVAGLAAMPAVLPIVAGQAFGAPSRDGGLHTVRIPGAGVDVPVVGIGTSRRYNDPQGDEAMAALRATLARFVELGGKVIDTAPAYGRAEAVVGQLVGELKLRDRLFLATKVGAGSKEEGLAQTEVSFRNLRTDHIDLIAVHNLRDVANQMAILRDLKRAGRIGALGITTSNDSQYEAFEAVLRRAALDTIQVDYALDNRNAADRILPLAHDKGVAVMINLPFGRGEVFARLQGKQLPDWAKEIGVSSWAQFALKYVLSHPCNPIAIPGTAQVRYAEDNVGAARGPMPDAAMRRRMEQLVDAA